jgi:NADH:ubiquinone oxidoreductase subunit F (NADH-binding)/NAD-dependent dihydropyrimidine dehydrogenase PreA subunit/(2Fe-2S) ferredoxin
VTFAEIRERAQAEWDGFTGEDRGRILVGMATCGRASGAAAVLDAARQWAAERLPDAAVEETGCLGLCYSEPLLEASFPGRPSILFGKVAPKDVPKLLDGLLLDGKVDAKKAVAVMDGSPGGDVPRFADHPMIAPQTRIVLRNCGHTHPESIDHYIANGGYHSLDRALAMKPEDIIAEVKRSGIRGRGGAGFPTGRKWELCRAEPGEEKYVICNADEGDPGAFMDRAVLESDPHTVIEGIAIAALAIGAAEAYIYVRAEYPLAVARLRKAIATAENYGLLGESILDSERSLRINIMEGAGAFVCGEETALLASIEGRRGMPRFRPPFPAQEGLFGRPTNINNVETLANIPVIIERGGDWFAGFGTESSPGTKTFALAGKINRTGLIEVPLGTTLRDIVYEIGGGTLRDKPLKAVQTGGPSGGCLPASMIDLPVDYENLTQAGSIMGSGGMVVMDDETCMVEIARYFLEFTQRESCGKCAPCRLGTRQMLHILERAVSGQAAPEDAELLEEIAEAVKAGSLCGLGQTAPNPALTTVRYFADEYDAHIHGGYCPAGVCAALTEFSIDPELCICCGKCARECPVDCIAGNVGKPPWKAGDEDRAKGKVGEPFVIDSGQCIRCGVCRDVCPTGAVFTGKRQEVESH